MEEGKGKKEEVVMVRAAADEQFDGEKWVHDSSTDHKGRLPLRASTGAWRASLFIIGEPSTDTYI